MKPDTDDGERGDRFIDDAEPGQKIADVLPDDLRYGVPAEDRTLKITPCCKVRFRRKDLFDQHRERWLEENVCLGSACEEEVPVTVGEGEPGRPADEVPAEAEQLVDEVGWWS